MKSILCVIDFSEASLNALTWAADMAQLSKSYLHIMYPYRLNHSFEGDKRIQFKKETEALALNKFKAIEKAVLAGKMISFDFTSEVGFLTERVNSHVSKNSLDLLVISRNVSTTNKENFDELLSTIAIPVVVVP